VRELENVVERAVILCETDVIKREDVSVAGNALPNKKIHGTPQLQEVEKNYILSVLEKTGGNQTKASRLLGLDRKTLYLKLKKYGITS
jgi:DNA-binding NtrC family response regulator